MKEKINKPLFFLFSQNIFATKCDENKSETLSANERMCRKMRNKIGFAKNRTKYLCPQYIPVIKSQ